MADRIRGFDWANSSLGSPDSWHQSLRVVLRLMLNTELPMVVWWGSDLVQFYNDAYAATLRQDRHPHALGVNAKSFWHDRWPLVGPHVEHVMSGCGAVWDKQCPFARDTGSDSGWRFGYSPIDHEEGVGGVLVTGSKAPAAAGVVDTIAACVGKLFAKAASLILVLEGPGHVVKLTNAALSNLTGGRLGVGTSLCGAVPEIQDQTLLEHLNEVHRSGEPRLGKALPLMLREPGGTQQQYFLDYNCQPIVESSGQVAGVFFEAVDVTEHVRSQRRLRKINLELTHRVKNTLAVISSMASQTLRDDRGSRNIKSFQDRLQVLGAAHDILTSSATADVLLADVVAGALRSHDDVAGQVTVAGPDVRLGSKQAISLALAINELMTNARRHGALSVAGGQVAIEWSLDDSDATLRLTWRESGGPATAAPHREGFGSKIITRGLAADFGGTVSLRYEETGLICSLHAPISHLCFAQPFYDKLD